MENMDVDYDSSDDKKAIDDSKAGIKGLVDAGIEKIPRIFIRPPHELEEEKNICKTSEQIPVVDLSGVDVDEERRKKTVDEIRKASEKWGFFQLINHGIPSSVLDGVLDGTRKFHEQDVEVKKEYYSSDLTRPVRFYSNVSMYKAKGKTVAWKDSLYLNQIVSGHIEPETVPPVCRKPYLEFINHVNELGNIVLDLLSEALGLKTDYLNAAECASTDQFMAGHYSPACPQPELALSTLKHTDGSFITILLQDQSGGLQVMCNNQWADVEPIEHSLVVNIGDLLQIISNDKFVSATHRVIARNVGPRISVAYFFNGILDPPKVYAPIKELVSEENPPLYKELTVVDCGIAFTTKPIDKNTVDVFRL